MSADPLSELLRSVRVAGHVFCRAQVRAPWGVSSVDGRMGVFHAIVEGTGWLCGHGQPIRFGPGDLILAPLGAGHILADDAASETVPLMQAVQPDPERGCGLLRTGGDGSLTRMVCGTFRLEGSHPHPLLEALPAAMVVPIGTSSWAAKALALLDEETERSEPGNEAITARLVETLFIHGLRHFGANLPDGYDGWLRGMTDPRLSRALSQLYGDPGRKHSTSELAKASGMSRSGFFARFTELVGEPPAQFQGRWRMHAATTALENEDVGLDELADRLGYGSASALTKAFKKRFGLPPQAWRTQRMEQLGNRA